MSLVLITLVSGLVLGVSAGAPPAFASSGSIRVDPAAQTVPPGATFAVNLVQTADTATVGAGATITFDPAVLQVQDVQPGPGYASTSLLVGPPPDPTSPTGVGEPVTLQEAIANANQSGTLIGLTAFLPPGTGSVDAGDNVFVTLTMVGVTNGTSQILLSAMEMGDDQFNPLDVSGANGSITVSQDAPAPPPPTPPVAGQTPGAPQPSAAAGATGASLPSAGGGKTPTVASGVLGDSAAPSLTAATLSIAPATQKVAKDATFEFELKQAVDGSQSAAQAKVVFRKDLLEVVKIEPGSGWSVSASALDAAAKDANGSGELNLTLTADKTKGPPTSGELTLATVTMRGLPGKEGKSTLKLATTDVVGTTGNSVPVKSVDGAVIVGSAGGGGLDAN